MRDQANRARNFHQQSQRQQQHHFHHVTHQQHNRHPLRMEPRNVTQARIGSLPEQTSSLSIQQNQKISHVLLSPHIVQHKPRHMQMQQVSHGAVGEGSNQQWMIGLNHRNAPQFSQQDLHRIQEQEMEKKRASIREQVEHGMVDSGFDFVVTGANVGINNRENVESRGTVTSQVNVSKGQEFDIFTDVDGHQHWYPRTQACDGKEYNVTTENSWVEHQEQVNQGQQTHLQHENHSMKASEQQQLFSLPCLVETESSAQGKVEQNSHHNFQRIITIPTSEMQCNEEESFNGQQYIICSSTMTHPQVRFSIQPHSEALQSSTLNNVWQSHERPIHLIKGEKEEVCGQYFGGQIQQMEVTKEDASYRESFETSSTDSASSTVKVKNNISIPKHEEIGQRNPNLLPLPAFQQAFGSTEIGRFANEGFLSQRPETPNWSDPSSPYGLPSPTSASKPNGGYFYSLPIREEVPTNPPISFPSSLSGYFDCSLHEDIEGPDESEYGDLLGLGEAPGFDFLALHQDGDPFPSASCTDQNIGENIL
ncbi:hypothetical protein J437_LFUL006548 [Ladona fulva]|uniref:Uncharacterized protein n=1 Tax=Ladona fulva TaxID=123851 RepID=A0A8K0KI39_LADFU|nr:hypothetical protein J437_LFUL006548 [Ladona fulva]